MTTFKCNNVFFLAFGLFIVSISTSLARCPAGQYLSFQDKCEKCPTGSFMDEDNHSNRECKQCQEQGDDTVLLRKCNATHDTVLECKEWKYNTNGKSVVCQPCTQCTAINMYEAVKCYPKRDAICCPEPAMSVEKKNGINNCSQPSTDRSYCCVEKTTAATKSPVSEPISEKRTTELNTRSISEKSGDFYASNSKSPKDDVNSSGGLSGGAIGGIVAPLVVVIIIIIVIFLLFRCRTQQCKESLGPENQKLDTTEKDCNV